MTLQPAAVIFDDVELWATAYLRAALAGRPESFASNVRVSNSKSTATGSQVVVRRDGGPQRGLFDYPRLTVRVWASTEKVAADLSRLVKALLVVSPGNGPVVASSALSGPSGVPDDSGPQKLLSFELTVRGSAL